MDYRGARFYDSDVARFLSLDPLAAEFPDWSDYNYVLGNPVMFVDPDGRSPQHDYKLNKDGSLTLIRETNAENHTIFNENESSSIEVDKNIIDGTKTFENISMKLGENTELIKKMSWLGITTNTKQAEKLFFFLADNTNIEWGLSIYGEVGGGKAGVAMITTEYERKRNFGQLFTQMAFLNEDKNLELRETWHNHPNEKYQYSTNSNSSSKKTWTRHPTGYYENLTPLPYKTGDRKYLYTQQKIFKQRVPIVFFSYDAYEKNKYMYWEGGAIMFPQK